MGKPKTKGTNAVAGVLGPHRIEQGVADDPGRSTPSLQEQFDRILAAIAVTKVMLQEDIGMISVGLGL
ncbi:hypothetical protein NDU88_006786 [Pleurodeles waltl]|uniref:Uncharacterized protein n=1 Tax=Pleurodeles waltl TaxID=8319 RepID=A0AAV7N087_PLEWA|nr:hypothetical protein NDU88_006786 [Pleurodeles waltl]